MRREAVEQQGKHDDGDGGSKCKGYGDEDAYVGDEGQGEYAAKVDDGALGTEGKGKGDAQDEAAKGAVTADEESRMVAVVAMVVMMDEATGEEEDAYEAQHVGEHGLNYGEEVGGSVEMRRLACKAQQHPRKDDVGDGAPKGVEQGCVVEWCEGGWGDASWLLIAFASMVTGDVSDG